MIYDSISNCPLTIFIQVLVSGDLKGLIVKGKFSEEKISEAWDNIFYEYLKITDSTRYNSLLRSLKDIEILSNKYRLICAMVDMLSLQFNKDVIDCLRILGFNYKFERFSDPERYLKDILRVQKEAKKIHRTIEEIREPLMKESGDKVKETDFDSILVDLSRFQGYKVKKEETTVSEFVNILDKYKQHGKQRKN